MSPPHAIFFEASHWPSDHTISSRTLIGQPVDRPRGPSLRGALKTRSCSVLDSKIVHAWSLKSEEVFRIGLVDFPHVEP